MVVLCARARCFHVVGFSGRASVVFTCLLGGLRVQGV